MERIKIPREEKERARKIVDECMTLKNKRLNHDNAVDECIHFVLPRKDLPQSPSVLRDTTDSISPYKTLFTRSARSACQDMASGIFNYLTPKNQKWFRIKTGIKELDEDEDVYAYFDTLRDVILNELAKSNFTEIAHETYLNFGVVGTVCSHAYWDAENSKLVFEDIPYKTYWFTEDNNRLPNRVFREIMFTAEQAVDEFGVDAIKRCEKIWKVYSSTKSVDKTVEFPFLHLVEPRKHRDPKKIDSMNKKFASTYLSMDDKVIVKESGFDRLPYNIGRFMKYSSTGNVMGYSPAMDCMPIIKSLETLKRKLLLAIEKNINPPMSRGVTMGLTPNRVATTPNALNNFDSRNPESKPTPIIEQIRLDYGFQELEIEQKEIERAFHVDAFKTITNIDKSNATATEVLSREREALSLISPSISRIEDEWLEPLLQEIYETIFQHIDFPQNIPAKLDGIDNLKVEFTGMLSSVSKLSESVSTLNFFQELGVLLEFMPDEDRAKVLSAMNYYEIVKTLQENRNVPARFRKSEEEVEQELAEQQQQQQALMEQQQLADMAKSQNLNEKPQDGSMMAEMGG